jgi:hypothetical protein
MVQALVGMTVGVVGVGLLAVPARRRRWCGNGGDDDHGDDVDVHVRDGGDEMAVMMMDGGDGGGG